MRSFNVVMFLVGILRGLGGFPYSMSLKPPKISLNKLLVVYSVVLGASISIFFMTVLIGFVIPNGDILNTKEIVSVLNLAAIFPPFLMGLWHSLLRSGRLCKIIQLIMDFCEKPDVVICKKFDWKTVVHVLVVLVTILYITIMGTDLNTKPVFFYLLLSFFFIYSANNFPHTSSVQFHHQILYILVRSYF